MRHGRETVYRVIFPMLLVTHINPPSSLSSINSSPLHFISIQTTVIQLLTMNPFTLLTLGLAVAGPSPLTPRQATVASVDRYAGPGCTGTICNVAGAGDLHAGCNPITDACTASLKLNYVNAGCRGM